MARGNQRDKAREKNLKEQAAKVSTRTYCAVRRVPHWPCPSATFPNPTNTDMECRKARTLYVSPS